MLPFENSPDLLFYSYPSQPQTTMFRVRPYQHADKGEVYRVCLQTCNDGNDGQNSYLDCPDVLPDKLVGPFLAYSAENCFVVVDNHGVICGYVLCAPDSESFFKNITTRWAPHMTEKYQALSAKDDMTPAEELISSFHASPSSLSAGAPHPADWCQSYVHVGFLSQSRDDILGDMSIVKRAFTCAMTSLKIHAAKGVFTRIRQRHHNVVELYRGLGFQDLAPADSSPLLTEDWVLLGRVI